jgi:small GTP-binding protein
MRDITLKVVICGDFAVGKTSLVRSFLDNQNGFLEGYKPTIGVDIGRKVFTINSQRIFFQIWDLSGQPTFKSIRPQFYKRSDGGILVFDVTRKDSFNHLSNWLEELLEQTGQIPIILVGNKIDLKEEANEIITSDQAHTFADHISTLTGMNTPYIEASAITHYNNLEPFDLLRSLLLP